MKKIMISTLFLIFISGAFQLSFGQAEGFGLGVVLGEPTGISFKSWTSAHGAFDGAVAWSVQRYNNQTGAWETASWFLGVPAGVNFPIKAGESYLIYMGQEMNNLWFDGIDRGAATDLRSGLNLVCLPAAEDGFIYSSYEMLQDLGDETQVASVRRFDSTQGWQSTSWFLGVPSGEDFETRKGEGYLIYMKEALEGWRAY